MHKIWIINTTYNANLMKHQQGISLLVPWFHSVFSLVSNWRILQHASQVLSKSAPNVYYGQNAYTLLHACTLLACRPRCSLVALAVRLSPSQVAPRSLPLAVFPSLVAPRSSPLAVFPSPLNVPPGSPPLQTLGWEVSYVYQNVWRWKWFFCQSSYVFQRLRLAVTSDTVFRREIDSYTERGMVIVSPLRMSVSLDWKPTQPQWPYNEQRCVVYITMSWWQNNNVELFITLLILNFGKFT